MDNEPRRQGLAAGTSVVLILLLLLIVALLIIWGLASSPPDAPAPQDTAVPEAIPGSAPPAVR